jgi:multiple sugar transport system permease protein
MSTRRRRRASAGSVLKIVVGAFITLWTLLPLYWGLLLSVSPAAQLRRLPLSFVPRAVTGANFLKLLNGSSDVSSSFERALFNSTLEALAATVFTIAIGLPAAYGFVRLTSRAVSIAFLVVVFTLAVPVYFVLIPLFQMAASIRQVDTYQSVVAVL